LYDFFEAIEQLPWVQVISGSWWLYPAISVLHYFTIFWVVGTIALVDLRILGLVGRRQTASEWIDQLAPWTWTAMAICLVTGALMFLTGAGEFIFSAMFVGKMGATLAAVVLAIVVHRNVPKWDRAPAIPASAKLLAAACLVVWLGTILLGVEVANYGFF
jgi:hypothetical protein